MSERNKSFRPLDGESISKRCLETVSNELPGFRPLDGESISKHLLMYNNNYITSFRPLDGESISKHYINQNTITDLYKFPSPRRGINF